MEAIMRRAGWLLIVAAVLLGAYLAWQVFGTDVVAGRTQAKEIEQFQHRYGEPMPAPRPTTSTSPPPVTAPTPTASHRPEVAVPAGRTFALIRIPRFGKDYVRPVIEGIDAPVLNRGVGHYGTTAMPGQLGNFAIAGHRVTYGKPFNQIDKLVKGDKVVVETATAWYVYRVTSHVIVAPDHVQVLEPVKGQATITLTACHPKYSKRQRYVVFGALDQTIDKKGHPV